MSDDTQTYEQADFDNVEIEHAAPTRPPQSREILDFISMGQMVPSVEWIMQNVVARGKGHRVQVGSLIGWANKTERQTNTLPGGGQAESVKLVGSFEFTSALTGEISSSNAAYLPKKWATLAEQAVLSLDKADVGGRVKMALQLGVRATGKGIPYTWTVNTLLDNEQHDPDMEAMRKLVASVPQPRLITSAA